MGIRIGNRARIGHQLPGGFYGSVPVTFTQQSPYYQDRVQAKRRQRAARNQYNTIRIASMPLVGMVAATVLLGIPSLVLCFTPAFIIGIPFTLVGIHQWLVWAANPQHRQR